MLTFPHSLTPQNQSEFYAGVRFDTDGGSFALANGHVIYFDAVQHDDHDSTLYVVQLYALPNGGTETHSPDDLHMGGAKLVQGWAFSSESDALKCYTERIAYLTLIRTRAMV